MPTSPIGLQFTYKLRTLSCTYFATIYTKQTFIQAVNYNLWQLFGVLSQTTLRVSICEEGFDILVRNPLSRSRLFKPSFLFVVCIAPK